MKKTLHNTGGRLVEVTTDRGKVVSIEPMSWPDVPSYLRWTIEHIDQLAKFKTADDRSQFLEQLQYIEDRWTRYAEE